MPSRSEAPQSFVVVSTKSGKTPNDKCSEYHISVRSIIDLLKIELPPADIQLNAISSKE